MCHQIYASSHKSKFVKTERERKRGGGRKARWGERPRMVFPIPEEDQFKVIFSYIMNSRSDRVA